MLVCVAMCLVRLPLVVNEALQTLQLNAFTPTARIKTKPFCYLNILRGQRKQMFDKPQN